MLKSLGVEAFLTLLFFVPNPVWGEASTFISWMATLPDETPLNQISIIGTHNSLSHNYGKHTLNEPSRCQKFDVLGQLRLGARYLDLRFRHQKNELIAFHGHQYLGQSFREVAQNLCIYLQSSDGNSESVIVRLRRELPGDENTPDTRTWHEVLEYFFFQDPVTSPCLSKIWFPPLNGRWPTLGEARGKIVIIEDFSNPLRPIGGINVTYGPAWHMDMVSFQDNWKVANLGAKKAKLRLITGFFKDMVNPPGTEFSGYLKPELANKLLLNHVSGAGAFAWPFHLATGSKGLNRRVTNFLCEGEGRNFKQLGIVVIDFLGDGRLIEAVTGRNWGKIC